MNARRFTARLLTIAVALAAPAVAATPAEQAQATIDKGLAFLKTQQQPDGGWQASDRHPPAITALALRAFVQDDKYDSKTDFVARGFTKLLGYQTSEGGIYKDLLANYNTAISVSALIHAEDKAFQPQIDKAIAYLKQLQWTEETKPEFVNDKEKFTGQQVVKGSDDPFYGGWGYGGRSRGAGRPDLSNTQFAVEALRDSGVPANDPAMQKALQFIARCQNNSETNDQQWAGNDGGFVYGPSDDRSGESFAGATTDAGGKRQLRSMGTMSYAGLKSMIYAGLNRDDARVRAVWAWINQNFTLEENVGLAAAKPEAAKSGLLYCWLSTAKALRAYGKPQLKSPDGKTTDWRVALIEKAAAEQKPDGSWVGYKAVMEDNPILATSYVVLALQEAQADLKAHPAK
ncbi:MAG TPA: prenyltransferase/squalene oxidase repeat-containing protein [Tepidisphaeraceae bacterium]|jgi:squalene-hopene/tetraprenyl-beta-curcumene cyclase